MACQGIEEVFNLSANNMDIVNFLSYPTHCDWLFYAKIMVGLFIILTFVLYFNDRRRSAKPDIISNLGISALAMIIISIIGTMSGIIQSDVFIMLFVGGMVFVAIWLLKK